MSAASKWFKSSYSTEQGGNCLEAAFIWFKSSYSGSEGGECVEVATHASTVHVRDSKNPEGPSLTVSPTTWQGFVAEL